MSNLPYDSEVHYIESTGTEYIDTNVILSDNQNNKLYIRCASTNNAGTFKWIFGSKGGTKQSVFAFANSNGSLYDEISGTNWTSTDYKFELNVPCSIELNATSIVFNGSSYTHGGSFVYSGVPIAIFGCKTSTGFYDNKFIGKVYEAQIWDNDVLVRDFIPVRVSQVGYLYDKISGQLFGNAGTGDFVVGPDKVEEGGHVPMFGRRSLINYPVQVIKFRDAEVKRILVENWGGADGGTAANNTRVGGVKVTGVAGELTYKQAASIINIGTVFKGNTTIEYFTEMEYLTSMTGLPYQGFEGCSNLKEVELVNITGLNGSGYHNCFKNCTSLYELGDTTHITKLNGASIFQNTAITKIDMPLLEATTSDVYFSEVFNGCSSLVNVNLPLVNNIGRNFFKNCNSIEHLELPELNYYVSSAFVATIKTIKLPKLITASANAFSGTETGIIIGNQLQEVANEAFGGGYALQIRYVVIKTINPPTCGTNILRYNKNPKIYVPDASVNAYKATAGFDTYANYIFPISQFATDFPDDVPYL